MILCIPQWTHSDCCIVCVYSATVNPVLWCCTAYLKMQPGATARVLAWLMKPNNTSVFSDRQQILSVMTAAAAAALCGRLCIVWHSMLHAPEGCCQGYLVTLQHPRLIHGTCIMHDADLNIITQGKALFGHQNITCREMYSNANVWMQTFDHCWLPLL